MQTIRHLLELIRFSHTLFALPFALLAAVMAWTAGARSSPPTTWRWQELVGIVLCMAAARSFAMALNRVADRHFDAINPRTAGRHLPTGILSFRSVVLFTVANALAFVLATLLFLPNWLPLCLSLPVLAFLAGYSYTKRFTSLSHFWLGAALMLAPVSTWIAIRGQFVLANPLDLLPALALGGAVLSWVAGFDVIYACQDVQFDRRQPLHSVPVRLGVKQALRVAVACHAGMVVLLALVPLVYPFLGWIWLAGVAAIAVLLAYEHWLVKPDDLARVNVAFFNVNAVVSVGLLIVGTVAIWA